MKIYTIDDVLNAFHAGFEQGETYGYMQDGLSSFFAQEEFRQKLCASEIVEILPHENVDYFEIADQTINKAYPGEKGMWGAQHIPNWGILRGAIERALRNIATLIYTKYLGDEINFLEGLIIGANNFTDEKTIMLILKQNIKSHITQLLQKVKVI